MQTRENDKLINSLDPGQRRLAVSALAWELAAGTLAVPPVGRAVNVHLHTCFSFNAAGYSPAGIVWEARKRGLCVVGSVDFDVLDAMDELFAAGDALQVRTVAAMETRVFMDAYADRDINSPGEPGVSYFMGTGFARPPASASPAGSVLRSMRETAQARNRALLERLAGHLAPVRLDYDRDVVSLTPAGNATERHMLVALADKAAAAFPEVDELIGYWCRVLSLDIPAVKSLIDDRVRLLNTARAWLMKRGGVGYLRPGRDTFPPIAEVADAVRACGAVPCATWLDGTSAGESDPRRLLDDYLELGCLAINIVPDRNWNITDQQKKRCKLENLGRIVEAAVERDLVFSVGTEMNAYGQRFVDDFEAPELRPFADRFRQGALILYGHTVMERALGAGLTSVWARKHFGHERGRANAFYLEVGQKAFPPQPARERLAGLDADAAPRRVLANLPGA